MSLLNSILRSQGVTQIKYDKPVFLSVDHIYGHDRNTFKIANEINLSDGDQNYHFDKFRMFQDHYSPPPDIETAELHQQQREISHRYDAQLFEVGSGVGHQIAVENFISPGDIALGVDSHTPTAGALCCLGVRQPPPAVAECLKTGSFRFDIPKTLRIEMYGELRHPSSAKDLMLFLASKGRELYNDKLMEFGGSGLESLSISDRFTMCNLSTDIGARSALCEYDEKTANYMSSMNRGNTFEITSNMSEYDDVLEVDLSTIEPMVCIPPSIFNAHAISKINKKITVNVVTIGSCTNGRVQDFIEFMEGLEGNQPRTRTIATPASKAVYIKLNEMGLISTMVERGIIVNPPGCGPCMGLHQGLLTDQDVCVTTGSRNAPGRMGAENAKIYISSPFIAGRVAATGELS